MFSVQWLKTITKLYHTILGLCNGKRTKRTSESLIIHLDCGRTQGNLKKWGEHANRVRVGNILDSKPMGYVSLPSLTTFSLAARWSSSTSHIQRHRTDTQSKMVAQLSTGRPVINYLPTLQSRQKWLKDILNLAMDTTTTTEPENTRATWSVLIGEAGLENLRIGAVMPVWLTMKCWIDSNHWIWSIRIRTLGQQDVFGAYDRIRVENMGCVKDVLVISLEK